MRVLIMSDMEGVSRGDDWMQAWNQIWDAD